MKRKWRNGFIISLTVACALVVCYLFVLPFLAQLEVENLTDVDVEYEADVFSITDMEQLSELHDHLNISKWKRVFHDNNNSVPAIYIAVNNRYRFSFTRDSNQDQINVCLCFLKSNIIVGNYIMDVQHYNRLTSFLDSMVE